MLKFVLASCLVAAAAADGNAFTASKDAKILKEQRYNVGDGRHGSAYAQEDGVIFREETLADGERVGMYSYIDDKGKTITVKYTAGKEGFKILEGAHVPTGANGQNSAPYSAESLAASQGQQQQQQQQPAAPVRQAAAPVRQAPAPIRQAPVAPVRQAVAPRPVQAALDYDYNDAPVDPNFNPFINPHDPTHQNFQYNANAATFTSKNANSAPLTAAAVPNCANCAGVNPFINPFDASHSQAGLLAGHQAGLQQQQPRQPAQPAFNAAAFQQRLTTTPAPRRFFPPGQLKLNRFESGFNFDFASQ